MADVRAFELSQTIMAFALNGSRKTETFRLLGKGSEQKGTHTTSTLCSATISSATISSATISSATISSATSAEPTTAHFGNAVSIPLLGYKVKNIDLAGHSSAKPAVKKLANPA